MKRSLIAGLTVVMATLALAPVAIAAQATFNDPAADLNGDGMVTLTELKTYNMAQRNN